VVLAATAAPLHDPVLASGITPDEYDRYVAALDDPDVIVRSPEMISAWGRRRPSSHDGGVRRERTRLYGELERAPGADDVGLDREGASRRRADGWRPRFPHPATRRHLKLSTALDGSSGLEL
jgi:hypothetical protein